MSSFHQIRIYGPPVAWLLAGSCAGLACGLHHTLGVDSFAEQCQEQVDGVAKRIDKTILVQVERIKINQGWQRYSSFVNTSAKIIPSTSMEMGHRGTLTSRWGAVIAVPAWFQADEQTLDGESGEQFLDKYDIPDLDSETRKALLLTFRLSKEAKEFALAKELSEVRSYHLYILMSTLGFCFPLLYVICSNIPNNLHFPGVKLLSFSIMIPLTATIFFKFADYLQCGSELKADKKAAGMNERSPKGGVEFYESLIQRQKLLEQSGLEAVKADRGNDLFACLQIGKSIQSLAFLNRVFDFFERHRKPYLTPTERLQSLIKEYDGQLQTSKDE